MPPFTQKVFDSQRGILVYNLQGTEWLVLQYVVDDCQLITTTGRSSDVATCTVQRTQHSIFHCCSTVSLKSSTSPLSWFRTYPTGIPPAAENAPV